MSTKIYSKLHGLARMIALVAILCLPFLSVSVEAQCAAPTGIRVATAAPEAVTLQWTVAAAGEHHYDIRVATRQLTSAELGAGAAGTATAATEGVVFFKNDTVLATSVFQVTGLTAGSQYYLHLRKNCAWDDAGYSSWVTYAFNTPCQATAALPIAEGFNADALPSCWNLGGNAPTVYSYTKHGSEGKSIKLTATAGEGSFLYSPVLATSANAYYLTGYAYGAKNAVLKLGFALTEDLQTVVEVGEVAIATGYTWQAFDVVIPAMYQAVCATAEYVWVIYTAAGNTTTVYVDDITLATVPPCVAPVALTVGNVTDATAVLSWTERGTATAWNVQLVQGTDTTIVPASANPFTLSNLSANTSYKVRVQAACGSEDSDWTAWASFKTVCPAMTLPYSEDFNTYTSGATSTSRPSGDVVYPDCWTVLNETGSSSSYPQAFLTTNSGYNVSGNSFFVKMSSTTPLVAILPALNILPETTLQVSFRYRTESTGASNGHVQLGYTTSLTDASSFVQLKEYAQIASMTAVNEPVTLPAGTQLAFRFVGGSADNYYASIDNVVVRVQPTCFEPTNLGIAELSETSVTLGWTPTGNETSWELKYQLGNGEVQTVVANNTPAYTITGLEANTSYTLSQLSLRAICSATDSSSVETFSNITFKTLCGVVALPIFQDFETSTFPGECWTESYHLAGAAGGWTRVTGASDVHAGSGAAKLLDAQNGNRNVIATPFFHSDAPNTLQVSFWMKRVSSSKPEEGVRVWVNTIATDTLGGTPLIHVTRSYAGGGTGIKAAPVAAEGWYKYTVAIPMAGDVCLLFEGISEYGNYSLIDDIEIDAVPTCPISVAEISVLHADQHSVTLTWDNPDNLNKFELTYKLDSADVQTVITTENSYTITSLEASSSYTLSALALRSICAEGDTSKLEAFGNLTFKTACDNVALPFTENFDGITSGIPDCWDNSEGTTTTETYKWNSYSTGYHGRGLRFNSYSNPSGNTNMLKTPTFQVATARVVEVSFAYKNSTGDDFSVYVSRDGGLTYADEPIATGLVRQTTWKEVEYTFAANPSDVLCIVFKATSNYGSGDAYINLDEVTIKAPLCSKPNEFQIEAVSPDSLAFSWANLGADSYQVLLFDALPAAFDEASATYTKTVSEAYACFTGLLANHLYYVYVKADCTTESSEWSDAVAFRTECAAHALPYVEGFEIEDDQLAGLCLKTVGNAVTTSLTTAAFDGNKALRVVNDSVAGMLILPKFDVATLAPYEVSFAINLTNVRYHNTELKPLTIGVMTDPTNVSSYIDLGDIVIPSSNGWKEYRFSLADLATSDYSRWANAQYIAISMSDSATYLFDAIKIALPASCVKPTALDVQSVGEDVVFDWVSEATTHYAEIALGDSVVFAGNVAKPFTPAGLEANTSYKVRVRTVCDAEVSEWTPWLTFTTPCALSTLPFVEKFDSYPSAPESSYSVAVSARVTPDCWKFIAEGTSVASIMKSTTYSSSAPAAMMFYGTGTVHVVMPTFNANNKALRFRMTYRTEGTSTSVGQFVVGYLTNPSNVTSFVSLDTLAKTSTLTAVEYIFPAMQYVTPCVLYVGGASVNWYAAFDDVMVDEAPTCIKPTHLGIDAITTTSANLTWTPGGSETSWELIYKLSSKEAADTVIVTGTPSYTITGLTSGKNYLLSNIKLQAICSETDSSEVYTESSLAFATECSVMTLPFVENFDALTSGIPACWDNSEGSTTTESYKWSYNAAGVNDNCVRFNSFSNPNDNTNTLKTPVINVGNVTEVNISFWYKNPTGGRYDVCLSYDGGATYSDTLIANASASIWTKFVAQKTVAANSQIALAFYGVSNYGNGDAYLYMDELEVAVPASCDRPASLTVLDVTDASAIIKINDLPGATWEYALNSTDAAPVAVADSIFTINGLESLTNYELYVRRVCSASDKSAWTRVLFTTACSAVELPIIENFASQSMPSCWTSGNWSIYSTSSTFTHTGSYTFYCSSSALDKISKSPAFEVEAGKSYYVTFYMYHSSSTYSADYDNGFELKVVGSEEKVLDSLYYYDERATGVVKHSFTWVATTTGVCSLQFSGFGTSYGSIYLDDIEIDAVPACVRPEGVQLVSVTSSTATMHVIDVEDATAWEYVLNSDTVPVAINNATFVIEGLAADSTYDVYVRRICSETEHSAWVKGELHTACGAFNLPFAEDFNTLTAGIPSCWSNVEGTTTSDSYKWSHYATGATGACVRFNSYMNSTGRTNVLATPTINLTKNSVLTFSYKNPEGGNFEVKISEDGSLERTTLATNLTGKSAWTAVELDLSAFANKSVVIYFCATSNYGSGDAYIYLDDVNVVNIPETSTLQSVAVTNVERRSFDIAWTPKVVETPCTTYDLVISTVALDAAGLDTTAAISIADTTGYHAEGLTRNTHYYVYVRTSCMTVDGAASWVSTEVTTSTMLECASTVVADGVNTTSYLPVYGLYADEGYYGQMVYPASMLTDLVGKSISQIKFFVSSGSNADWADAVLDVYMAEVDYDHIDANTTVEWPTTPVYSGLATINRTDGFVVTLAQPFLYNGGNLMIECDQLEGVSDYESVSFYGMSQQGAGFYVAGAAASGTIVGVLPKVEITTCVETDPCPAVDTVMVSAISARSAHLTWPTVDADYLNGFEVLLSDTAVTDFENVTPQYTGITETAFDLTSLTPNSDYYAYVRAICNAEGHDDGVAAWKHAQFKTKADCENVENLTAKITSKTTATITWAPTTQTNNFTYVLSFVEMTDEELEAAAKTASNLTDTFALLTNLAHDSLYYCYVANECGEGSFSPFEMVSFKMPATCPAVTNLHAENLAFNAARLAWNRGFLAEENEWEVGVVGDNQNVQVVYDSTAVVLGLLPDSTYTIYVKAICGAEDSSAVAILTLTTPGMPPLSSEIGGNSNLTTTSQPTALYYNYTTSEQIYTAQEIGRAGDINSIAFYYTMPSATTARDIVVYVKPIDKDNFSSTSDWADLSLSDKVFEGEYVFAANSWNTISFNHLVSYDGESNLLVVVDDNTGSYIGSGKYFGAYSGATNSALYSNSDSNNIDPLNPSSSTGTRTSTKSKIKINFEQTDACGTVRTLAVSNVDITSAEVAWMPGAYELQWAIAIADHELTNAELLAVVPDTLDHQVSKTFTGLTPDTDYFVYVRALCSETEAGEWVKATFMTLPTCEIPVGLNVADVEAHTAKLIWSALAEDYDGTYQVAYGLASDTTYTLVVSADTTITLTGLEAITEYAFAVRAICGVGDTSRWSNTFKFRTDCAIYSLPFAENFNTLTAGIPFCWDNSVGTTTSSTSKWNYFNDETKNLDGPSVRFNSYSNSNGNSNTLKTPEIDVTDAEVVVLKFAYKNPAGGTMRVVATLDGRDTTLYNFPAKAPARWTNYEYIIPVAGVQSLFVKYAATSNYGDGDAYLYLDNIRVANLIMADTISDAICEGYEYTENGFNIPASKLTPGYKYDYIIEESAQADIYKPLKLFVSQATTIEVTDTVCYGGSYTKNGFNRSNITASRDLRYDGVNMYGCDSTFIAHIFVPEHEYASNVNICEGESYVFGDTTIYTAGRYVKTFQKSDCDCDSTVTLVLNVLAASSEYSYTICQGETYTFGTKTYNATGDYTATFKNVLGCDSVVTLHLTVQAPVVTTFNETFCEGTVFTADNVSPKFVALSAAGEYRDTIKTVSGCDSILVLNLTETKTVKVTLNEEVCKNDLYVFAGNTFNVVNDTTITFNTVSEVTGCDSIVTLNIKAKDCGDALENVRAYELEINPNPVNVGEEAIIRTDIVFTAGYVLRVYDPAGRLVCESTDPNGRVPGLPVAGAYTVRISAADHNYQAKLIVK